MDNVTLLLHPEWDSRGGPQLFGVRYATFAPRSGLHPLLGDRPR